MGSVATSPNSCSTEVTASSAPSANPTRSPTSARSTPTCSAIEVLDVRDTAALRAVVERTVADLGRIDVVISNAGYGVFGAAEELSDEQVEAILATNLTASIQLIRAVLPHMREAAAAASSSCPATAARSPSRATRCITPPSSASRASANRSPRRSLRSASASRSSNPAAPAPNSVTAVPKSPTRCPPTWAPPPAHSRRCSTRPTDWPWATRPAWPPPSSTASTRQPAPLRIVLGSQALESTVSTLRKRIADFESQKDLAASTDYPVGV